MWLYVPPSVLPPSAPASADSTLDSTCRSYQANDYDPAGALAYAIFKAVDATDVKEPDR